MDHPTVSIIMANYNGAAYLRECLDSIYQWTTDIRFEIILVDDASIDQSVELVRNGFPRVHIVENPNNVGFARSNNVGVRHARGNFLLLLNTDIVLHNNAVRIMHDYLLDHPGVGVCGAWLVNADGSSQVSYGSFPSLLQAFADAFFLNDLFPSARLPNKGVKPQANETAPRDVSYVTGAALMTRKEIVDQIGLFDERIFMYCEETDYCYRVRNTKKLSVRFIPEVRIIHYGGLSFRDRRAEQIRIQYSSYNYFLRKHHSIIYAVIVRLLTAWHYGVKLIYRAFRFVFSVSPERTRWKDEIKHAWYAICYSIIPDRSNSQT